MKPKNIKEFQALVKRYETITLEEIDEQWYYNENIARDLTGIGSPHTCTLCLAVGRVESGLCDCSSCVYNKFYGCVQGENSESYDNIIEAESPEGLLSAFHARAEHLRKTYPQYLES